MEKGGPMGWRVADSKQGESIWHILGKRAGQAPFEGAQDRPFGYAQDRLRGGSGQVCLFLLLAALSFCHPTLCYGGILGKTWSRADRYLATFDPAGSFHSGPQQTDLRSPASCRPHHTESD